MQRDKEREREASLESVERTNQALLDAEAARARGALEASRMELDRREEEEEARDIQAETKNLQRELESLSEGQVAAMTEEKRKEVQSLVAELERLESQDSRLAAEMKEAKDHILEQTREMEKAREKVQRKEAPPSSVAVSALTMGSLLQLAQKRAIRLLQLQDDVAGSEEALLRADIEAGGREGMGETQGGDEEGHFGRLLAEYKEKLAGDSAEDEDARKRIREALRLHFPEHFGNRPPPEERGPPTPPPLPPPTDAELNGPGAAAASSRLDTRGQGAASGSAASSVSDIDREALAAAAQSLAEHFRSQGKGNTPLVNRLLEAENRFRKKRRKRDGMTTATGRGRAESVASLDLQTEDEFSLSRSPKRSAKGSAKSLSPERRDQRGNPQDPQGGFLHQNGYPYPYPPPPMPYSFPWAAPSAMPLGGGQAGGGASLAERFLERRLEELERQDQERRDGKRGVEGDGSAMNPYHVRVPEGMALGKGGAFSKHNTPYVGMGALFGDAREKGSLKDVETGNELLKELMEQEALQTKGGDGNFIDTSDPRQYDPKEGVYIYFDMLVNLPIKYTNLRIAYGFYNGHTALSPVLTTNVKPTATDGPVAHCVFKMANPHSQLPNIPNCRVVMELQYEHHDVYTMAFNHSPYVKDMYDTADFKKSGLRQGQPRMVPVGWTAFEIFDDQGMINLGKWRLPVLRSPPHPAGFWEDLKLAERVGTETMMCLRVGAVAENAQDVCWEFDPSDEQAYEIPIYWHFKPPKKLEGYVPSPPRTPPGTPPPPLIPGGVGVDILGLSSLLLPKQMADLVPGDSDLKQAALSVVVRLADEKGRTLKHSALKPALLEGAPKKQKKGEPIDADDPTELLKRSLLDGPPGSQATPEKRKKSSTLQRSRSKGEADGWGKDNSADDELDLLFSGSGDMTRQSSVRRSSKSPQSVLKQSSAKPDATVNSSAGVRDSKRSSRLDTSGGRGSTDLQADGVSDAEEDENGDGETEGEREEQPTSEDPPALDVFFPKSNADPPKAVTGKKKKKSGKFASFLLGSEKASIKPAGDATSPTNRRLGLRSCRAETAPTRPTDAEGNRFKKKEANPKPTLEDFFGTSLPQDDAKVPLFATFKDAPTEFTTSHVARKADADTLRPPPLPRECVPWPREAFLEFRIVAEFDEESKKMAGSGGNSGKAASSQNKNSRQSAANQKARTMELAWAMYKIPDTVSVPSETAKLPLSYLGSVPKGMPSSFPHPTLPVELLGVDSSKLKPPLKGLLSVRIYDASGKCKAEKARIAEDEKKNDDHPKPSGIETPPLPIAEEEEEEKKEEKPKGPEVPPAVVFVENVKTPSLEPYDPQTDGWDVYVDGVRFPPDCTLCCRVKVRVVTSNFDRVMGTMAALSTLDSRRFIHPTSELRMEYRRGPIDPTALLQIRVDVIDVVEALRLHRVRQRREAKKKRNNNQPDPLPPFLPLPQNVNSPDTMRTVFKEGPQSPAARMAGFAQIPLFIKADGAGSISGFQFSLSARKVTGGEDIVVREPVTTPGDTDFRLNQGNFQIDLSMTPYPVFSEICKSCRVDCLQNTHKVPLGSVLLRILPAPRSRDGLKSLSRSNVPQTEWERLGLQVPAPKYEDGVYDTYYCLPSAKQRQLLNRLEPRLRAVLYRDALIKQRQEEGGPSAGQSMGEQAIEAWFRGSRQQIFGQAEGGTREGAGGGGGVEAHKLSRQSAADALPLRERIVRLMAQVGSPFSGPVSDDLLLKWVAVQFGAIESPAVRLLDFNRVLAYSIDDGFRTCVDALHQAKRDGAYAVSQCVYPPGGLYRTPPVTDDAYVTTSRDWSSHARSPLFHQQFRNHTPHRVSPRTVLVFEALLCDTSMKADAPFKAVSKVGWTVLPLFDADGYFVSGFTQLPLFSGPVNLQLLGDLESSSTASQTAWSVLEDWKDTGKVKLEGQTSIFVRHCDAQRQEQFTDKPRLEDADTSLLPESNLSKYLYSEKKLSGKMMQQLVPKNKSHIDVENFVNGMVSKYTQIPLHSR
uniref:Uncharacterized protein n=1 Tax=Chromera velia CCMP2878 TaxID=1169474 RepID=A0A0G4F8M1_9ALVE|eukprot:Cvel_15736.t1-p1 / transcript=Cvel_15736.t1 / gene=Cvel_15736 / organism=Chromera_velia_CCMP2878 / gene_product=hypothetical protein / transcript_product=hypothetical protein / location=Cvel_scaffold1177:13852-30252(+) / protein_length=2005 / sequence_SO=supercontig / SO=protein_coding / is_pseudo=false